MGKKARETSEEEVIDSIGHNQIVALFAPDIQ